MKKAIFILGVMMAAVWIKTAGQATGQVAGQAIAETPEELPLPRIPAEITDRAERVKYAIDHFWDPLDFNDTARSADEKFMGQNFANFALFLSYAPDSASQAHAASIYFDRAVVNDAAFAMARKTARRYLAGSDSPMRNDETWLAFLDVLASNPSLDESDKARYDYELEMARKNRIGTVASDFAYELPDGRRATLHTTPAGTEGMYLIFYDPDCDTCHEAIEIMRNSGPLNAAIRQGRLAVLAVDAEEDRDEWLETATELPADWTVGFNTDRLIDRELYAVPSLPTIYLLDPAYRVKAKDLPAVALP